MTKKTSPSEKILIEGVTPEGKKFRPSDWADRMSGKLATFKNSRIKYSPMLQPSVNKKGNQCVLLDPSLKQTNPDLYDSILSFAKHNQLNICDNEPSKK
tara:strand:+ start:591 stop:887 length:297 start_codon:yes stop_codon:yes gene_type:complete